MRLVLTPGIRTLSSYHKVINLTVETLATTTIQGLPGHDVFLLLSLIASLLYQALRELEEKEL